MPLLLIGLAALGAYLTRDTSLFVPAIVNAVLSFWANGVLANFRGGDWREAPNWAATLSMLTTAAAIAFAIYGWAS